MLQQSLHTELFTSFFITANVALISAHEHLTKLTAASYLHPPVPPPPTQRQGHHPGLTALAGKACSCSSAGEPPPGGNHNFLVKSIYLKE